MKAEQETEQKPIESGFGSQTTAGEIVFGDQTRCNIIARALQRRGSSGILDIGHAEVTQIFGEGTNCTFAE